MRWHGLGALTAVVWVTATWGQPPYLAGVMLGGVILPGMPIPVNVTGGDGQQCAFACTGRADCAAFNWAPTGCSAALRCPHTIGCCWLLSSASGDDHISVESCAGSFMMRPAAVPPQPPPQPPPAGARNVLYVLVDDLRPDLAPYGPNWMVTPNVQRLADAGVVFQRAYCNIAVCSPSRMSFLTGRYPSHTLTWNFVNHFRQSTCREAAGTSWHDHGTHTYASHTLLFGGAGDCCSFCTAAAGTCVAWTYLAGNGTCWLHDAVGARIPAQPASITGEPGTPATQSWTSLPQWFTRNGYLTQSSGKIFHTEEGGQVPPWDGPGTGMPPLQDPISWSPGNGSMANVNAVAPMRPCVSYGAGAIDGDGCSVNATKEGDVPPGVFALCDRIIREDAVPKLQRAIDNRQATGQPFFMAVGFRKPHLPFRHPAPWDTLYPPPASIPLAVHQTLDASVPPIAFHQTSIAANPYTAIPALDAGALRRDYYAAISWMDWNLGLVRQRRGGAVVTSRTPPSSPLSQVLDVLSNSSVANDTLIVFHADHGWSLG